LCYGGSLEPDILLAAYQSGIFPFYCAGQPVLWWSPDPRMVLFPDEFYCSKRLRRRLSQSHYRLTHNADFSAVIQACAAPRNDDDDQHNAWLLPDMIAAYTRLHQLGHAHSFEVWCDDALIGGVYGVLQRGVFFAESMFHHQRDGSKIAMANMIETAKAQGWKLVDCQFHTEHLASMGAKTIPREQFLRYIHDD